MSTVAKIKSAIEDRIVSGEFAPGSRIHEAILQNVFQTSRTPIREALLALSVNGFVTIKPRSGMFVSQLTEQELLDIFELLAYAEGLCALLVTQRITPTGIKQLSVIQEQGLAAYLARNVDAYNKYNKKFHEFLYQQSGNNYLLEQIQHMRKRTSPYRAKHLSHFDRMTFSWLEHKNIVQAIKNRDADQAQQAALKHITQGWQMYSELGLIAPEWFVFAAKDVSSWFDFSHLKEEDFVFPRSNFQQ